MTTSRLATVDLPDFGRSETSPELSGSRYGERVSELVDRAVGCGLDWLVVYADREHSANLAFLSGFEPRFEEAILILGADDGPAVLVGNECYGLAGMAPLQMRRRRFQDLSLPSQPRDRSLPVADILGAEGIRQGSRVGVVGWKTYGDRALSDAPSYLVDGRAIGDHPGDHRVPDAPRIHHHPRLLATVCVTSGWDWWWTTRHRLLGPDYFKRFAVQGLKIDRSFVGGLGQSARTPRSSPPPLPSPSRSACGSLPKASRPSNRRSGSRRWGAASPRGSCSADRWPPRPSASSWRVAPRRCRCPRTRAA